MTLAYLGPKGTFSEQAALKYLKKRAKPLVLKPFDTIYDVIMAVADGKVKEGIVPIENSVEGSISVTLDLLASDGIDLFIIQEIDLEIINNLIALKGTKKKDIKTIYSHPQPIGQCQDYLHKNFQGVHTISTNSTADAVHKVKMDKLKTQAAIGSSILAEQEDMIMIAEDIGSHQNNITRFVVLAKKPLLVMEKAKTSFAFSIVKDRPGGLYEILGRLAGPKINMTKIESRPNKSVLGEYIFFIDIEGSPADPKINQALEEIRTGSSFFKLFGSYQRSL